MDIEQALLEQVRSLTPEQQQEVLDFRRLRFVHCPLPFYLSDNDEDGRGKVGNGLQ